MPRLAAAASLSALVVLAVGACTPPALPASDSAPAALLAAPVLALARTDSCPQLLDALRAAGRESVGPYGFHNGFFGPEAATFSNEKRQAATDLAAEPPAFSGTNVNEAAADEPDTVKTDGKRIVSVLGGILQVIDASSRTVTGSLRLSSRDPQLLLRGDRALVLSQHAGQLDWHGKPVDPAGRQWRPTTEVSLISLVGQPRIISSYEIAAAFVDARQIGSTARVVVRSVPTIAFAGHDGSNEAARLAANRSAIDAAPVDRWLPAYTTDGSAGRVGCGDVRRPATFTGGSMVTMLSFGLDTERLGDGAAVSLLADSQTVYSNGTNLYLAHDARPASLDSPDLAGSTELYQFDISGSRPEYVAAGTMSGRLLNQYSLNEHQGVLRAATTSDSRRRTGGASQSSVITLRRVGGELVQVGRVDGLGKGERIYSVRFIGDTGYVVTFRQTDPLYTVDLRDPARPAVVGALKIPGYSAYLHPVADGRLLGLGRGPASNGRTGTQVSLFDVSALATAERIGLFTQADSYSAAEHDPHAFLYWQPAKLMVVPLHRQKNQQTGFLLLRVEDRSVHEAGFVEFAEHGAQPERALVVGDTLWMFSASVAVATTLDGSKRHASLIIGDPIGAPPVRK